MIPPTVEIPEYNGDGNSVTPPTVDIPEYDKQIGGSLDGDGHVITPPTVGIPEYSKPIYSEAIDDLGGQPFVGGANTDNAPVNDVPEFVGGANPDNAPVNDVPGFAGAIDSSGVSIDKGVPNAVDTTRVMQKSLPNTGDASSLLALGSALSMIGLAMRRKHDEQK